MLVLVASWCPADTAPPWSSAPWAEPPAVWTEAREGRRGRGTLKQSVLASPFLGRGPDGIRGARESSERPAPKGGRGLSVSERKRAQHHPLWVPDGTHVPWATRTAGSEGSHLRPRAWSHASVEEGQCPRHGTEASRRNQIRVADAPDSGLFGQKEAMFSHSLAPPPPPLASDPENV